MPLATSLIEIDQNFLFVGRDLVAGVRYTLNELQRDVLHRRTWMWLIPLLQILNRYLKNSERGLNYDKTTWWGVQQLKSTIDSHRNTYPRV